MQHLIRKQIIDLKLPKHMNAFSVQQSVSMHYWKHVVPIIEQVFNELSDLDETISIDRLEINLGHISEDDIKSATWSDSLVSEMRDNIRSQLEESDGGLYVRERNAFSYCRQWLFYMQNGHLPWNIRRVNKEWYDHVLEAFAVDFSSVMALRKLIRESILAARRIVLQHREDFLVSLVEILTAENQSSLAAAIAEMEMIFPFNNVNEGRSALWEQSVRLAAERNQLTTEQLIESLILKKAREGQSISELIEQHASRLSIILPVLQNLKVQDTFIDDNSEFKPGEIVFGEIDEEGIHVHYAGLVLVHPYLHALFKRFDWVQGGLFRDIPSHLKALCLLHYIATGKPASEEYEMVIPKVLCAWAIDEPVSRHVDLSNLELSEADNMLEALIENWEILRNTSIDGLREGFIYRDGKLFRKNGQLILQVEGNTIDVLLDQLPWNISMIKLPWMKELLRVEWR